MKGIKALGKAELPACQPADLAIAAPDGPDALRRAERLFEAAAQSGIDLTGLGATPRRIATLACQSAPYLATLLTRDPHRLDRVASDPYLAELAARLGARPGGEG